MTLVKFGGQWTTASRCTVASNLALSAKAPCRPVPVTQCRLPNFFCNAFARTLATQVNAFGSNMPLAIVWERSMCCIGQVGLDLRAIFGRCQHRPTISFCTRQGNGLWPHNPFYICIIIHLWSLSTCLRSWASWFSFACSAEHVLRKWSKLHVAPHVTAAQWY